jgi:hypothetical protein
MIDMRKALQIGFGVGGLLIIAVALMVAFLGPSTTPGFGPENPTMDSEARFDAALFGFLGVAILWCIKDIERKGVYVRFPALAIFAGGLARVFSALVVGLPNTFFLAMMSIELGLPPSNCSRAIKTRTRCSGPDIGPCSEPAHSTPWRSSPQSVAEW